jgi:hypothetical protein
MERCYRYVNRPGEMNYPNAPKKLPQISNWFAFYNSLAREFVSTVKEVSMPYRILAIAMEIRESLPSLALDREIASIQANLADRLAQYDAELRDLAEPAEATEAAENEDPALLRQQAPKK